MSALAASAGPIPGFLRFVTIVEVFVVAVSAIGLYVWPAVARELWAWSPAPFNARHMGAIFFTALLPLGVLAWTGRWDGGRVVLWLIFSFTSAVMLAMFIHHRDFAWSRPGAWGFWFLYLFLPVNSAIYLHRLRHRVLPSAFVPRPAARSLLDALAWLAGVYGLLLLLWPTVATAFWPWPVDSFHGRMYASACLAPAVAAVVMRRRSTAAEWRILGAALVVLGVLSLAGVAWTSAQVPAARQVNFAAPATLAFGVMQLALLFTGAVLCTHGGLGRLPTSVPWLRWFTLGMGLAFTLAGVAGFVPGLTLPPPLGAPPMLVDLCYGRLLGLFPVNVVHNLFHLAVGVAGLLAWRREGASLAFTRVVAVALGLLTLMGLGAPWDTGFGVLPVYGHAAWLHGLEALLAAYLGFVVPHWSPPARRLLGAAA